MGEKQLFRQLIDLALESTTMESFYRYTTRGMRLSPTLSCIQSGLSVSNRQIKVEKTSILGTLANNQTMLSFAHYDQIWIPNHNHLNYVSFLLFICRVSLPVKVNSRNSWAVPWVIFATTHVILQAKSWKSDKTPEQNYVCISSDLMIYCYQETCSWSAGEMARWDKMAQVFLCCKLFKVLFNYGHIITDTFKVSISVWFSWWESPHSI